MNKSDIIAVNAARITAMEFAIVALAGALAARDKGVLQEALSILKRLDVSASAARSDVPQDSVDRLEDALKHIVGCLSSIRV
ncbi:MAG: hypothetical protein OYM47_20160 [Gemmatimonadota bacterium]|nr:hypothetical protein [Gemmatimonadota bacterium]